MIATVTEEAVESEARPSLACAIVGLSLRTVERWRGSQPRDARHGPRAMPADALSTTQRADVLVFVNSPSCRDASPHQIVTQLADAGVSVALESTIDRLLREAGQLSHRGRAQESVRCDVPANHATGPKPGVELGHRVLREQRTGRFLDTHRYSTTTTR